jgi:GH15 family glucan-1,4-alpha-glucosidase
MRVPLPQSEGGRLERVDGYSDLRGYAVIGDGRTVAAIARDGCVDWMPVPAIASSPVFAAIVDAARGGHVSMHPVGEFGSRREYVAGSNVLRTTFTTPTGTAVVTDALVTGVAGRLPWTELARRVDGVRGTVDFEWEVVPGGLFVDRSVQRLDSVHGPILRVGTIDLVLVGFEHGRTDPHEPARASGTRPGAEPGAEPGTEPCPTGPEPGPSDGPLAFSGAFTTNEGSRHLIALCGTDDEPIHLPDPRIVDEGIDRTIDNWVHWSEEFSYDGAWSDAVERSALALKLLISSPSGSIVAAGTTGLPESLDGGKNYDYRFAWVRDLAYTVGALARFGLREEPHAAVAWVLKALKRQDDRLTIFFTPDGDLPDGVTRTDAEGWRGIGPVDVGNGASGQLQLGVYADVLGIMRQYVDSGNILDGNTGTLLVGFADKACTMWEKKDSGMWELPKKRHYTTSKIGCWRALDDALRLAELGEIHPSEESHRRWVKNRALIATWIAEHCWSKERGAYVMHPGSDAIDASILLHITTPFGSEERMRSTIDVLIGELGDGPHVYRYSGMQEVEGSFVACSFWLVEALAELGRLDEAEDRMAALVDAANDVGLYSEMIDPETGDFLGNLPQGLSHLALVNAAVAIDEARERAGSE